ncbi:MerR family transcriptional regulator [Bacillus xiapuensis]|uniref:MerR family transcriptional regulator n=1 Tax=Bacillus xiapuensis TaxID=2014075 RepID=UPI000C23ACBC|nr:MerR family transcriptional regulator [Bacillus xiapuensis]
MKVKEVADLAGISVRTLHHYDEIGLLVPDQVTAAGYRVYSEDNLETLQQILFFKELDFPLKKIKEMINNPAFDRKEALRLHRKMLLEKRHRIDRLLKMVDQTIQYMKGEIDMTHKEKFAGFDFSANPYEQEARERWGDQAVETASEKISQLTEAEHEHLADLWNSMASLRHHSPASKEAQEAMKAWYGLLNKIGNYSLEAFKGLGQLYVADERFRKNIDQFGEGFAGFLKEAMEIYAEENKQ